MTPPMTNPTAAELDAICAMLTKAQREALHRAELDGKLGRYFVRFISGPVAKGLVKQRLGTAVWSGVMLSPLGILVAAHLKEQEKVA